MPQITALYAGLCGVMLVALGYHVVLGRNQFKTSLGIGTERQLEQRVRVHANFAENVPMALLLLGLSELTGTTPPLLHAAGATLVVARLLHAVGLGRKYGRSFGRFWGTAGTWTVIGGLSLHLLWRVI